jgi:Uma2 family endonuclease
MPLLKERYTSKDYWALPEGCRSELIDGQLYDMAPPSRIHQEIVSGILYLLKKHIESKKGGCKVYPAPFAVNLDADDKNWVEPDISVICDPDKLTDRGCSGAPDFIVEVVSPGSRRMDYAHKVSLYLESGVREYWIVDPDKKRITVYDLEHGDIDEYSFSDTINVGIYPDLCLNEQDPSEFAPIIFPFESNIKVGIYADLSINISQLL